MSDSEEQGFNESELQDIMSEIENLEDEFSSTDEVDKLEDLAIEGSDSNEVQSSIDNEVEELIDAQSSEGSEINEIDNEIDELNALGESLEKNINQDEVKGEDAVAADVTHINDKVSSGSSQVSGSQLNFKMNFKVGNSDIHLNFQDGLHLVVAGIEVKIDETQGCSVELPGGIKFSVPLDDASKKKAA